MTRRVILTADDFGLCPEVNAAVERAHREGVLTCASLMVTAPAAEDAIGRARAMPNLGVGLHLVLVEGRAALAPGKIASIVDASGNFTNNPARAGFRYFFHPLARRHLAAEIRAQFAAFQATGLTLDHVNAHNHLHLHPTILGLILEIGRDFGLRAVRLPREPYREAATAAGRALLPQAALAASFAPLLASMSARLRRAALVHNDWIFGLGDSGHMTMPLVERQVAHLPEGVTEFYFHPATGPSATIKATMPDYEHAQELAALLDPSLRSALEQKGLVPIRFQDLPQVSQ